MSSWVKIAAVLVALGAGIWAYEKKYGFGAAGPSPKDRYTQGEKDGYTDGINDAKASRSSKIAITAVQVDAIIKNPSSWMMDATKAYGAGFNVGYFHGFQDGSVIISAIKKTPPPTTSKDWVPGCDPPAGWKPPAGWEMGKPPPPPSGGALAVFPWWPEGWVLGTPLPGGKCPPKWTKRLTGMLVAPTMGVAEGFFMVAPGTIEPTPPSDPIGELPEEMQPIFRDAIETGPADRIADLMTTIVGHTEWTNAWNAMRAARDEWIAREAAIATAPTLSIDELPEPLRSTTKAKLIGVSSWEGGGREIANSLYALGDPERPYREAALEVGRMFPESGVHGIARTGTTPGTGTHPGTALARAPQISSEWRGQIPQWYFHPSFRTMRG